MATSSAAPDAKNSSSSSGSADEAVAPAGKDESAKGSSKGTEPEVEPEPEISMHQFLRVSGVQPDQSAGFVRWATKNMGGRYGLTAWKQAMADFWKSPAR